MTPTYLSSMIPSRVGDTTPYPLRNSGNIRNISCKSQLLSNSFLPSTINTWNALPADVRSAPSLPAFKRNLNKNNNTVPQFYYDGDRKSSVHHARLRMHCSSLNEHLFSKNIVDSPYCQCGEIEDTYHFFFICPLYRDSRSNLFDELHTLRPITLQLLLFGSKEANDQTNSNVFKYSPY